MDLAVQCRSPMGKYLIELDKLDGDPDTLFCREFRNRLQCASSTRASTCQFTPCTSQTITYVSCIVLLQQNYSSVPIDSEQKLIGGLAYQEKKESVHVVKMSRLNPLYYSSALKLQFCDWNIRILTLIAEPRTCLIKTWLECVSMLIKFCPQ